MTGKRYAFLIGCNDYIEKKEFPALHCSANDVEAMKTVLENPRIGKFDEIHPYSGGESSSEILTKVEEIITAKAGIDDTILFYFSGHGKTDRLGKLCLALKGTKVASLDSTSIAIERIVGYMNLSRCRANLTILDCCYSGAIKKAFTKKGLDDVLTAVGQGRGMYVMTSSTAMQPSAEKEGDKNSIFTKFLVEGLQSGEADLDTNGWVTVDEAYDYTSNLVKGTGLQTPTKFNLEAVGGFILAANPSYEPLDPSKVPDDQYEKFYAVKSMIENMGSHIFMVMLFNYDIEGERYGCSGLTVSPDHTQNMRQTQDGFECNAFFPPHLLTVHAKEGKEVINGVIKVRLKAYLKDILIITGVESGGKRRQLNLYGARSASK